MRTKVLGHRMGEFEGEKRKNEFKRPKDAGTKPIPEFIKQRYFFDNDNFDIDEELNKELKERNKKC